jgi:hypothetical protein
LFVSGVVSSSSESSPQTYSTFHNIDNRKKFTMEEWDDFTSNSTKQALAELAASTKFRDWFIEHADRISLLSCESPNNYTMQALTELAASKKFKDWFVEHADHISLLPSENSNYYTKQVLAMCADVIPLILSALLILLQWFLSYYLSNM